MPADDSARFRTPLECASVLRVVQEIIRVATGRSRTLGGGRAVMRIGLVPDSALQFHILGILTVTCLRGDKIPDGAKEGVRLNLEGALLPPLLTGGGFRKDVWGKPLNFNKEIAGLTVFVAI